MTELLQLSTLILLVFIWRSIGKLSERIATQTATLLHEHLVRMEELTKTMREQLEQMDSRLEDIEERIEDNFETDEERQSRVDREP